MKIQSAFLQHIGLGNRLQNDALFDGHDVYQAENIQFEKQYEDSEYLVALADGSGSHNSAGMASKYMLERLNHRRNQSEVSSSRLIRNIHADLCNRYAKASTKGAATTIVTAYFQEQQCQILNVGDSRAYKINQSNTWTQLSHDHTVINRLRDEGLAQEDVEYASFYHALDDCLIADHESTEFSINQHTTSLVPGDCILLCSDGVHNFVKEQSLRNAFDLSITPLQQLEKWADLVFKRRAPDNFSMILTKLLE